MPLPVLYPKVSLEMETGRIARWLVADGETVSAGQVIFEIDNDKAAVEVEAPGAGVLRHLVAEGAEVDVGAEVARIAAPAEAGAGAGADAPTPAARAVAAPVAARPAPQVSPAPVPAARAQMPNPTPLARRIAREKGLDLSGLPGTGPRGRVQKADVLALLSSIAAAPVAPAAGPRPAAGAQPGGQLNAAWLRRGTGMPVVLLHGYSADLNNWRGLFAGTPAAFPVLALDLPAHGASPRAVPADADALCAQVEATLAGLVEGPLVLAGHSFGGAVAARLAARGGLDLRGLCLFAPAGLGPEIDESFTRGILRARSAASLRPWLERLVHDPATISDAFVTAVAAQRQDEGLTAAMAAFAERFFPDGTQILSIKADLARLRVPARVIFGRQDRILPFGATRDLPATVGLHAVDGCGHLPHLEHPELALRLLAELWRSAG
ncbi:acetoin dehydrogenase dihydrolipoyllysine-residue acetyltransferase subunit [Xinfangfangia pollutisoli]|uniref:acetoin dehydrogenase dihydrolipoyllysine-residue acetyltransferase subunit n=1 Tax=Xinfangfangia pollutisoli TaxID=2865960 RepID=UPI001CD5F3E1|nr:acetoin dehydrogenase dihydrolipoyllysine-residue acetyltransferase subunit [Xinfangfangia pollutisoli]